jgi:hypothetical protein
LGGAENGRLALLPDEATELFDQIRNDMPVVIKPTPSP